MALPGWAPSAGSWVTPLPGWQRPEADPEAVNAELQSRAIRVRMGDFEATTARLRGGEGRVTLGDWTGVWTGAPDTT